MSEFDTFFGSTIIAFIIYLLTDWKNHSRRGKIFRICIFAFIAVGLIILAYVKNYESSFLPELQKIQPAEPTDSQTSHKSRLVQIFTCLVIAIVWSIVVFHALNRKHIGISIVTAVSCFFSAYPLIDFFWDNSWLSYAGGVIFASESFFALLWGWAACKDWFFTDDTPRKEFLSAIVGMLSVLTVEYIIFIFPLSWRP